MQEIKISSRDSSAKCDLTLENLRPGKDACSNKKNYVPKSHHCTSAFWEIESSNEDTKNNNNNRDKSGFAFSSTIIPFFHEKNL